MASTHSSFLSLLPPEIRLNIYKHLLTTSNPIKGPIARQHQAEKYNIHTSILRVNKQIHTEALAIFLSLNTFHITSVPPLTPSKSTNDDEEISGAFESPLQLRHLPQVRNLEIDLLYWPRTSRAPNPQGQQNTCTAAYRYTTNLSYLLSTTKSTLKGLVLTADARPYTTSSPYLSSSNSLSDNDPSLDLQKFLTGFHAAAHNPRFQAALASLRTESVALRFDFADSWFALDVSRTWLVGEGARLEWVAAQVLVKRCELGIRSVLCGEMGGGEGVGYGVEGIEGPEGWWNEEEKGGIEW